MKNLSLSILLLFCMNIPSAHGALIIGAVTSSIAIGTSSLTEALGIGAIGSVLVNTKCIFFNCQDPLESFVGMGLIIAVLDDDGEMARFNIRNYLSDYALSNSGLPQNQQALLNENHYELGITLAKVAQSKEMNESSSQELIPTFEEQFRIAASSTSPSLSEDLQTVFLNYAAIIRQKSANENTER